MKRLGMFIVSLRGANQGFWCHLDVWRSASIFSRQSIFLRCTQRNYNFKKNALISVFRVYFYQSLESSLQTQAPFLNFAEHWLVIKPIPFSMVSFRSHIKLKTCPDWSLSGVSNLFLRESPPGVIRTIVERF